MLTLIATTYLNHRRFPFLLVSYLFLATTMSAQTVTDIDGNVYNTVTIGSQTWMKENLKTTRFNNSSVIPTTTASAMTSTTSLYQWAYNDDTSNINKYGLLYTWFTISCNQNVCPVGWHVPDNTEWQTLTNFLGGDSIAGGKMKEAGILHWLNTNSGVNNSSGFTGLPGGFRGNPAGFRNLGLTGNFWSTTPFGTSAFQRGYCYALFSDHNQFLESVAVANCGMSVRCIQNVSNGIKTTSTKDALKLFPVPAANTITLEFETSVKRTCFIYDSEGKLVLEKTLAFLVNIIDIHSFQKGTYMVRVFDGETEVTKKFSKE
jgi:uncharacterized protein (TIGR02145 family)